MTTNDGMRKRVIMNPLNSPITAPSAKADEHREHGRDDRG